MSNTTAATLAQNEIALAGQKLPSERLDPENNERMSVIKIGRMRKHLSVKKSQQWVKAILSLNAGVTYEAEGYIGTLLGLDATKNTQAVELGVNAIREAVYLVTSKDDHDPEPTDDIAGFSGGEVWLITEKVTDEQTVLLGIVNQKRKGGALEILPIQNQLQSLFDLVVLIAATISSNAIPEESKGELSTCARSSLKHCPTSRAARELLRLCDTLDSIPQMIRTPSTVVSLHGNSQKTSRQALITCLKIYSSGKKGTGSALQQTSSSVIRQHSAHRHRA